MSRSGRPSLYKVKLESGRIIGPVDLNRIRKLIEKGRIQGNEVAREYPTGEWLPFHQITALGQLILESIEGEDSQGKTAPKTEVDLMAETIPLETGEESSEINFKSLPKVSEKEFTQLDPGQRSALESSPSQEETHDEEEKTIMDFPSDEDEEKTEIASPLEEFEKGQELDYTSHLESFEKRTSLHDEPTLVFEGSYPSIQESSPDRSNRSVPRKILYSILLVLACVFFGYEAFFRAPPSSQKLALDPIRPTLPSYQSEQAQPEESKRYYQKAIQEYLKDHQLGYRKAVRYLQRAVSLDISNVRALAMLASSYINLIDSSNQDESYFRVISKLIQLSRAKSVDLPETVIADVEFYITVNRNEAAQNRIVEYTKTRPNFDLSMFYYTALAFHQRGNHKVAARYLSQIPDNKVFSSKIFYLRGKIAEALGASGSAYEEYQKAIKKNPEHARSHLALSELYYQDGELKKAKKNLNYIVNNRALLSARPLARAFYLHGKLDLLEGKPDQALGNVERAVRLDPKNNDYLLELYSLRAKAGDQVEQIRKKAKMYYFLGQGEEYVQAGQYEKALQSFLEARQVDSDSVIPLEKIGDTFMKMNDLLNARMNYKKATEVSPKRMSVWPKYIQALIQSYEWDEANQAMIRFKRVGQSSEGQARSYFKSSVDRLSGDLFRKQGKNQRALFYYRKSMSHRSIDPDVYVSYAETLMEVNNFKDAPFFFALALRFDPLNERAIIGTAQSISKTESIEQGIEMLQKEIQKSGNSRVELWGAVARLYMKKGDWRRAQSAIDQAKRQNPSYAEAWKIQAELYRAQTDELTPSVENKILEAYRLFSEKNPSEVSGYLNRYQIYFKRNEFEAAFEEIDQIYRIYPKYPGIHFFRGNLYAKMGNLQAAVSEYQSELKQNPGSVETMMRFGELLLQGKAFQRALDLFTKSMQLAPRQAEPKHLAGYANYLMGNYQGAIALLRAAISIDKGNPIIYKRLGAAYRKAGDSASASNAFRRYLELAPDAPDRAQIERFL